MRAGVGFSDIPDSAAAGRSAVEQAVRMAARKDACDLVLLFSTARHDPRALRAAVSAAVGASVPIYGGGAVGVITNDHYGYAGDQVGLACLWLDGVRCEALTDECLPGAERDAGFRLGQGLARTEVAEDSPVVLLYDAVGEKSASGVRLNMATWLLEGLEKGLGFFPALVGAGLMANHACDLYSQYTGEGIADHRALALAFDGDIRLDSVIIHGCRPASAYYTVTKADGPVILEINGKPALDFMDGILGPTLKPAQYPFFLLFGIHSGERFGPYSEEEYAGRLCLGIDPARGGIVMFDPDMVAGTEFQIMFRSFDLSYMRPKFEAAFRNLNGRKPVFAMYINCIGRCAGYGGADVEDAVALQQAVAGRVPVLGIYTGVEIAAVSGRPRGLDLAGVFCLFSQGAPDAPRAGKAEAPKTVPVPVAPCAETPLTFLGKLCEQNVAKVLTLDTQATALRYELELKRRGFRLLSELAVSLRTMTDYRKTFVQVARRLNAALNMQKTVILRADGDGFYKPIVFQGFTPEEEARLRLRRERVPEALFDLCPAIVTSENASAIFDALRAAYALPYFIASAVYVQGEAAALLLTGRMEEQEPFLTRLSVSDGETVDAITELLGSILVRLRLRDVTAQAETDGLTGLWNRDTFKRLVDDALGGKETVGAFMMIDVDRFKSINDTYGHIAGDEVLKACAATMRGVLRDSDLVCRHGGDEFAVFCKGIREGAAAEKKAAQLVEACHAIVPEGAERSVTISVGIALAPEHGTAYQALYRSADIALYEAKNLGKNRPMLFHPMA